MFKNTCRISILFFAALILFSFSCVQGDRAETAPEVAAGEISAGQPLFAPVRPIEELRIEALQADPPAEPGDFREPELVELVDLDSTIKLDIRYATPDNFMGAVFYESARAFLQRPVAEDLLEAHRELKEMGLGLVIFDGYRPWYVTKVFWDATPEDKKAFVADPSRGSRHNRGAAVDVTLYDRRSGKQIPMPSGFDETTPRAAVDYAGGDPGARENRDLLISVMRRHGFEPLANEWWHYDHQSWREYPILNVRFENIEKE